MLLTVELTPSSPSPSPTINASKPSTPTNSTASSSSTTTTSNGYKGKLRVLIDFGQHAREYITSELALHLLSALSDPTGGLMRQSMTRALISKGSKPSEASVTSAIQLIKEKVVFKIIPMENEGGRDLVEGGKLCERKNGRGVDPNRNWPVDWGE